MQSLGVLFFLLDHRNCQELSNIDMSSGKKVDEELAKIATGAASMYFGS